jgi:hypothetical protein
MTIEERLHELERLFFEGGLGLTWEEFLHCFYAKDPLGYVNDLTKDEGHRKQMLRIIDDHPPPKLDLLISLGNAARLILAACQKMSPATTIVQPGGQGASATSLNCPAGLTAAGGEHKAGPGTAGPARSGSRPDVEDAFVYDLPGLTRDLRARKKKAGTTRAARRAKARLSRVPRNPRAQRAQGRRSSTARTNRTTRRKIRR